MRDRGLLTVDANEAVASVAHRTSEVIAIYPITPSSVMGELADEWSAQNAKNIWGTVPHVVEMQSEGGAAGVVHGALQAGALTTTFTASQGLLLMIPNMYKVAGELTSFCMHVAARSVATHALSIFGDHSDVMACRQTGFAFLASGSVQEAHDFAAIALASTLRARVPFLHFFDGFRTSHEVAKIEELADDDLRELIGDDLVREHRARALSPDHPFVRGTAQNPDTFFQAREAGNLYYDRCSEIVQDEMDRFAGLTGRHYHLFDYHGHPQAERVLILMGSGAETAHETVDWMCATGERVGVLKVRLYRPFSGEDFLAALPRSALSLAVLDRTKEPGALGEPLYLDVVAALAEAGREFRDVSVIGGRYGLSSKEFTPAMVRAVFEELLAEEPKNHFTVGINDDVTHLSLPVDPDFDIEPDETVRAIFFGLGSDGTVGANKNTIKIIGHETPSFVQGYFVYDSKKSGAVTISHLRFGPSPIRSSYLIRRASFVACHQWSLLEKLDVLRVADEGAVFLLNTPYRESELWDRLPREMQAQILEKKIRVYAIDALSVAGEAGLGGRISTIMQACFFALSGVLPREDAIALIKGSIEKQFGKKGPEVVKKNFAAVDKALSHLWSLSLPTSISAPEGRPPVVSPEAPDFVQKVTAVMLAGEGDRLPVSAFPVDGTWPIGTSRWEKRNIATAIPVWDPSICIQCNKCAFVCPHSAVRAKVYPNGGGHALPATFKSVPFRGSDFKGYAYTVQVAPEDCTGCQLCVEVCPVMDKADPSHKALNMAPQLALRDTERVNFEYFLGLPDPDRSALKLDTKGSQFVQPLFEFSGACAGCGETPYIKLLTQLFGDRLLIANATGCSSIYGANLPTTPYAMNAQGRGPAWANSLFEDNAEFGLGFRLAVDHHTRHAQELLRVLAPSLGDGLVEPLLHDGQHSDAEIEAQRERVVELKLRLAEIDDPRARRLETVADYLVRKSIWIVGGDGWAYDIGYGGLDHVLASHHDVNVLVLDTEVYSNTGGQQSKATPLGATAKFASAGRSVPKKDLGLAAMAYGHVYVARVAFGAKDNQTVRAIQEAESYAGPSIVIAYSHCIAHGYDMMHGLDQQRLAVDSGVWPLYRFDPRRVRAGEPPLKLDSGAPKVPVSEYMQNEARFQAVQRTDPERYAWLLEMAQRDASRRVGVYEQLSHLMIPKANPAVSQPDHAGEPV
jgi:pyruvate-ferredoxin/flavodoxin oxidoreductase